jgi:glycosyltransferase involved in cell wall biosynthesis
MLDKLLTIVIPCKNESANLYNCLKLVHEQSFIQGVRVIVADSSDEEESLSWLFKAKLDFSYKLQINVIKGGYPAEARLKGSELSFTPYILFLDADVMLKNKNILIECYKHILALEKDLITVPFETERGWNYAFRLFDFVQWLGIRFGISFAVGGFQFWRTGAYWRTGGYVVSQKFAEDYWVSSKCILEKFKVLPVKGVWTSARRFKRKGIGFMVKIMFKSYFNRNNPEFFNNDQNYWQ